MSSNKNLETLEFSVSWSNIQDAIAAMLQPLVKGKIGSDDDILSLKMDYEGGYVSPEKLLKVEAIVQRNKGVKTTYFGA